MEKIDPKKLARQIDAYCASNAISKQEFTKRTGISGATLSHWRNGVYQPSQKALDAIEDYTNMPIEALLGGHPVSEKQNAPSQAGERAEISDDAHHIGVLYDRADEKDRLLTHTVLDKYDEEPVVVSTSRSNPGKMIELDVWDEPAAAGLGNYLDVPEGRREQFPSIIVPHGTDFGIMISGNSMEPVIKDGATVFVRSTSALANGKIGIFVLNGAAYCKQLIVDRNKKQVRLHSMNPDYEDIIVKPGDDLRTVGEVL